MKKSLIILIASIAILAIGAGGFVGYDIFQDRQNIVVTEESVPAYPDWQPYPSKEMKPVFLLPAKTDVKVKRIRYGKDYMAIKVESEKGDMGWIFYGHSFRIKQAT